MIEGSDILYRCNVLIYSDSDDNGKGPRNDHIGGRSELAGDSIFKLMTSFQSHFRFITRQILVWGYNLIASLISCGFSETLVVPCPFLDELGNWKRR